MATYNPYAAQEADIARRKHMADVLEEQAFKPIQQFSYNGIPAPISPLSGLAKVLSSYTAGKLGREAAAAGVKLNEQQGTDTSAAYDYVRKLSLGDTSAVAPRVIPPGMGDAIVKAQIDAGHLAQYLTNPTGQPLAVVGGATNGAATATPQPLTPPVAPDGAATATPQPLTPLGAPGGAAPAAPQPTNRAPDTLEGLKAAYETAHADSIRLGKLAAGNPRYKAGADQASKDADLYLKALVDKGVISAPDAERLRNEGLTARATAARATFETGVTFGQTPATGGAPTPGATPTPDTAELARAAGVTPAEFVRATAAGLVEEQKELGKQGAAFIAQGTTSQNALAQADRLTQLGTIYRNAGGKFDAYAEAKLTLGALLPEGLAKSFGFTNAELSAGQTLMAESNRQLLLMIGPGEFPTQNFSDTDRKFVERITPRINSMGFEAKVEIARKIAQRNADVSAAYQDAREKGVPIAAAVRQAQKTAQATTLFSDADIARLFGDAATPPTVKPTPADPYPEGTIIQDAAGKQMIRTNGAWVPHG